MSSSTTTLDLLSTNQAQKEATANALFDAASPAMLYGRRSLTSGGLTWGYYGGTALVGGTPTQIANGTVTLTASAMNYIEADPSTGTVSINTTGFTSGRTRLYQVVVGASTVSSYTDLRTLGGGGSGGTVKSVNTKTPDSAGNVTLAAADVGADASGAASSAVSAHVLASDPHAQYLTQARGDARYPLASTEGQANGLATLGSDGKVLSSQLPASAQTGGTVTSVDLAVPGLLYTVSGGPVTGSGTLTFALKTQGANKFLAGPTSGADATPTMRAITQADLPAQPFDIHTFYPGVPGPSAKIYRGKIARPVTWPANFAGAQFTATANATGNPVFDIQKNGVSVGSCTIAAGTTNATFSSAGGAAVNFAVGDVFALIGPATADATLADPAFTFAGTR
jgi:hypothetical protein